MKAYNSNLWTRLLLLILSVQICFFVPAYSAGDITFRKVRKYFRYQGVDGPYTPEKAAKMILLFEGIKRQISTPGESLQEPEEIFYEQKITACTRWLPEEVCKSLISDKRGDIIEADDYQDIAPFLNYGLTTLKEAISGRTAEEQAYALMQAKNILYSIFAVSYEGRPMNFNEIAAFPFTRLATRIPYKSAEKRNRALGLKKARKEARFLTDPDSENPGYFLNAADLATKTAQEVSQLDVHSAHHIWHTKKYVREHPDLWGELEAKISASVRRNTKSPYDLHQARKLVFFHSFKNKGGTHGKIKVTDPWSMTWKLKWGNEYFTEALANRLYIALGGKHQDLNYAHTIENPVIMIFPESPGPKVAACEHISGYPGLKKCLASSGYQLDLDPYLHPTGYGVLQPHDLSRISSRLNKGYPDKVVLSEELTGKNYVVFNESSLEFKDKNGFLRSGPMSQSRGGSEDDRAMRGMLLFHMFVDNFDAKDANGESLLFTSGEDVSFLQAPVDLGGAFRGFKFRGRGINHFRTKSFLRKSHTSNSKLVYTHPMLYRPAAGDKATFSDLLWMAEKIVTLPRAKIRAAVRHTHTPEFYQEVLVYRILKRQSRIAQLFNLEHLREGGSEHLKKPDIHISLAGNQYKEVARNLHLPESVVVKEMLAAGIQPGEAFQDHVVKNGKVRKCHKSLLVNILEKYAFPSGLSRSPSKHHEKPGRCRFRAD